MQQGHGGFWLLGGVEEAKGKAAIGVYHHMQIDLAHALECAYEEGILGQQLARPTALSMALPGAGIGLLDLGHLLGREGAGLLENPLFQLEETLITAAHAMLDQNLLDHRRAHRKAL